MLKSKILKFILSKLMLYSLIVIMLICGFLYIKYKISEEKITKLEMLISARLVECAELCVLKYEYEGKVEIQHKKTIIIWESTSEYEAKYRGVIRAGIPDIREIDYKTANKGKTIIINLPPVKILGNDTVDEGTVIIDHTGWIASEITKQEVLDAIKESKAKRLETIEYSDFLENVKAQIQKVLYEQFTAMGFKEVIFR